MFLKERQLLTTQRPSRDHRRPKGSTRVSIATYRRESEQEVKPNRDPSSVFPATYDPGLIRNPKTVLVLDDVKPIHHPHARFAIDAAANFGGLVIMTSNFGDASKFAIPTSSEILHGPASYGMTPQEAAEANRLHQQERMTLQAAFLSRISGNFREIAFGGPDHRGEQAFWADHIDSSDFR